MKINSINFYNSNLKSTQNRNQNDVFSKNVDLKSLYPANYNNYVSFGAKSNAEKLAYIGEENFPNETILAEYKEVIAKNEDRRLYQIHLDYYADLLNCKTLDEAKALYPEFKGVANAVDVIDDKEKSLFNRIKNGEKEGLTVENLSLKLLQSHYGNASGINAKDKNYGIEGSNLRRLFSLLNISELNKKYMMTMHRETPEYAANVSKHTTAAWQNPEFRQGRSEDAKKRWQREDYRQGHIDSVKKKWQDPEYRKQASERFVQLHQDPEFEAKRIASVREFWTNPETREQGVAQITEAGRKRWAMEGSRERMSAFMLEKWQDPEYREKVVSGASDRMKKVWQKPEYIEYKRKAMLEKWEDPEFRELVTTVNIEKWNDPEYRAKMQVYSEALKVAWEMHPEIREMMSEVALEYPGHGRILTKVQKGIQLTPEEQRLFLGYYKKCHEKMPGFTWIVGQTQKEIINMWKEEGIIPNED